VTMLSVNPVGNDQTGALSKLRSLIDA
jgi:hypothetical protein